MECTACISSHSFLPPHTGFDAIASALDPAAAVAEIAGCFAFWAWLRLEKPVWWIIPGIAALIVFAWLLSRVDAAYAGRAYAAYGGIYILASMGWMWLVEGAKPDRWDGFGVMLCVIGALVILFGPRTG